MLLLSWSSARQDLFHKQLERAEQSARQGLDEGSITSISAVGNNTY